MNLIEHFVNGKIIPGSSDKKGKVLKIWKNVKVKNHAIEVLNALESLHK